MGVKYFWGMRKSDDMVVSITELTENERGMKCNCVCPVCREDFLARMGEKRTRHFAHSGKGCIEEKANMTGLFQLIADYINAGKVVHIPLHGRWIEYAVRIGDTMTPVTPENIDERIHDTTNHKKYKSCQFEKAEVIFSGNGYPQAIIADVKSYQLAIRVIPPTAISKKANRSAYKDSPTIVLDLSEKDFYDLTSVTIGDVLQEHLLFNWIRYYLSSKERDEIYLKSVEKCRADQEKLKQQLEQLRKTQEEYAKSQHLRRQEQRQQARQSMKQASSSPPMPQRKARQRSFPQDSKAAEISAQIMRDDWGYRIARCKCCGQVKRVELFSTYGGQGDELNCGVCNNCSRR